MRKILVTGAAGFIGFHLAKRLIANGDMVTGLDNVNDYYDVTLKQARLGRLEVKDNFRFIKGDLSDRQMMEKLFAEEKFDCVVNLAAQAGVRYSLKNPYAYIDSNIMGFMNILEGCRHSTVRHLVYASSSSVYGANTLMPFSVHQNVDHPVSLYAATKKANELMAHTYSSLYGLPTTGLRFFTVYGPWGRPDMALFLFTRAILAGEPIDVYNYGNMQRDFTYIDDIIEGVVRVTAAILLQIAVGTAMRPTRAQAMPPTGFITSATTTPLGCSPLSKPSSDAWEKPRKRTFSPSRRGMCRPPTRMLLTLGATLDLNRRHR
jgi:UDP-glucuronate 4-epimerase